MKYEQLTYDIIGAAISVHNELGCGFLESVYQEALAIELAERGISFVQEAKMEVIYKGKALKKHFIADFICDNKVVVELKALSTLSSEHDAQVLNYLKATTLEVGLLINFGETSLIHKRLLMTKRK